MPQALTELLRGKGAHADPIACIEDIPPNLANQRIENFPHTIADLVFHMNYWMAYELRRIRGEKPNYPNHNAESFPTKEEDWGEEDWESMRNEFTRLLSEFGRLADSPPAELDRQIEPSHETDKNACRNSRVRPLANGRPQQLSHRTDRHDPPRPGCLASTSRRRQLVREMAVLQTAVIENTHWASSSRSPALLPAGRGISRETELSYAESDS